MKCPAWTLRSWQPTLPTGLLWRGSFSSCSVVWQSQAGQQTGEKSLRFLAIRERLVLPGVGAARDGVWSPTYLYRGSGANPSPQGLPTLYLLLLCRKRRGKRELMPTEWVPCPLPSDISCDPNCNLWGRACIWVLLLVFQQEMTTSGWVKALELYPFAVLEARRPKLRFYGIGCLQRLFKRVPSMPLPVTSGGCLQTWVCHDWWWPVFFLCLWLHMVLRFEYLPPPEFMLKLTV